MNDIIRIGTRGSPLALIQATMVKDALAVAHGLAGEIVVIKTTGDRVQDRALAEIGGKALWTKELDRALLAGEIDCAVHSMKDVETIRPEAIVIAAMLPRADVRDRLIGAAEIAALRQGALVGTSSPRRAAQLRRLRPDVKPVLFRGNVDTRLAKLAAREVDATLLAAAGLDRLGRADIGVPIESDVMLPAPAQGAVGIEARTDDARVRGWLAAIDDGVTHRCVLLERALLAALSADCHSPVAALAREEVDRVTLRAELLAEDGSEHVVGTRSGAVGDFGVAEALAADLLTRAPPGGAAAVRRVTYRIAVLRPEPGNAATVGRVTAAGWEAIALPLFVARPLAWTAPDPGDFDGVLFTSANAPRHGGAELAGLTGLPAFAVGENSARAARDAGFDVKASGDGDAAAIVAQARSLGHVRLLHLGGRERTIAMPGAIAVYASEPVPVGAAAMANLAGSVALLHSARAAQRLVALRDEAGMTRDALAAVAISAAVAEAAGTGWRGLATAAMPHDDAMIAAARALVD